MSGGTPQDHIQNAHTYAIELRPRIHKNGEKARGDREIWRDGQKWGHVRMVGHGCHGPSYEFHDADGDGIYYKDGQYSHHSLERVGPIRRRSRHWGTVDNPLPSTDELIIAKARELMDAGRMPSPTELKKLREEHEDRFAKINAEEREKQTLMRDALRSLHKRADLTNAERAGIQHAYAELFHSDIAQASAA